MYCQSIVRDKSLRSIRDLRGCHINMLQNIMNKSLQVEYIYIIHKINQLLDYL